MESRSHPRDHRAHIYDIRPEPLTHLEDWLDTLQRNYKLRRRSPTDLYI